MSEKELVSPEAYTTSSVYYDLRGCFILKTAYRDSLMRQISFFSKNLSESHLEAAVGSGSLCFLVFIYAKINKIKFAGVGFDYTPKMVKSAQRLLRFKGIEIIEADARNLSFADESFTTVNLANSYHAVNDPIEMVKEFYRVLKPGGTFAFNVLLCPKGSGLLDRVSNRVNSWGQRIGILYKPYHEGEVLNQLSQIGFFIISSARKGNSLYIVAKKQ